MRRTGTPSWLSVRRGEPTLGSEADNFVVAPPPPARVWAVGGGKGGIGKSFLVANLATVAARSGKRVILIDADLGGANLHTCLGVRAGERVSLSDYFEDRVLELDKVAIETPIPGPAADPRRDRSHRARPRPRGAAHGAAARGAQAARGPGDLRPGRGHRPLDDRLLPRGRRRLRGDHARADRDRERLRISACRVLPAALARARRLVRARRDPRLDGPAQRARHPHAGRPDERDRPHRPRRGPALPPPDRRASVRTWS